MPLPGAWRVREVKCVPEARRRRQQGLFLWSMRRSNRGAPRLWLLWLLLLLLLLLLLWLLLLLLLL